MLVEKIAKQKRASTPKTAPQKAPTYYSLVEQALGEYLGTKVKVTPLKSKKGFEYDEFSKSWKYYASFDEKYSDATESVTIILFSEDNGTNLEDVEIRAGLVWKDAAHAKRLVTSLELLIDGDIYHIDMKEASSGDTTYSFLYNDTSYQLIQALSKASSLKIKIIYDYSSTEHELKSNPFKSLCSDIVKYNIWDYYIPNIVLFVSDNTTVR